MFIKVKTPIRTNEYKMVDINSCGTIDVDTSTWDTATTGKKKFTIQSEVDRIEPVYLHFGFRWNETAEFYLDPDIQIN